MKDYQRVLSERADRCLNDDKALDHVGLQNKRNRQAYVERMTRHSLGQPLFHVKPTWWQKLRGK